MKRIAPSPLGVFVSAALALTLAACGNAPAGNPDVVVPPGDQATAEQYPTVFELYGGAQGIYRGCGPNGNVCHNMRQYPNMNTLGSLTYNIGKPCNQLQDDPAHLDDWCERVGDRVHVGDMEFQLGYIALLSLPTATEGARWAVGVQGNLPPIDAGTDLSITRAAENGYEGDWLIGFDNVTADPNNPSVAIVQLDVDDDYHERILEAAGIPGNPEAIQFGDANRNGNYGHALGNALILPGHPERSYIIKRLTDPSAGPLMPLANCCFWTKPALRAMWCWIAGLHDDGANAMDPIDYGACPPGPVEDVLYPDPGPGCTPASFCPVRAQGPIPDDPTWANVYTNIITNRCAGGGCHFDSAAGGLDMHSSDVAYHALVDSIPPRVIPGDAANSLLHYRLNQVCSPDVTCIRMPLGRDALPDQELSIIDRWIQGGALMNGTTDAGLPPADSGASDSGSTDAGMVDSGSTDAGTPDTGVMDSGVTDSGTVDTGTVDTGTVDTGTVDTGTVDTGTADTGAMDDAAAEAGATDDAGVDAGDDAGAVD